MAKRKETGICELCGTKYVKCRFNSHHQKYCTRKACVTRRRQEGQRRRYREMYRYDKAFADAERQRCRDGQRKRRAQACALTPDRRATDNGVPPQINIELLAAGLLSQWIDSKDPVEVEGAARRLEKRGRLLAINAMAIRYSPVFDNF